jgi:hypothetical protein
VLDRAFAALALDRARAHAEANLADAQELFDNTLLATFDELLAIAAMKTLSDAADDFSRGKSRHRPRNDPKLYDGDYPFIQTGDIRRAAGSGQRAAGSGQRAASTNIPKPTTKQDLRRASCGPSVQFASPSLQTLPRLAFSNSKDASPTA